MTGAADLGLPGQRRLAPVALAGPEKFPAGPYPSAGSYFGAYSLATIDAVASVDPDALDRAARLLLDAYTRDATVFTCGNGGSAAIANHMQCDHVKGVSNSTDLSPRVVSLSANVELMTAIANDSSYEQVYVGQLRPQARPGDVLVAISSGGRSPNIVRALSWAADNGLETIALTGFGGGDARTLATVSVHVACANYGIVEDLHQAIMHSLAQYLRQARMARDAISAHVF